MKNFSIPNFMNKKFLFLLGIFFPFFALAAMSSENFSIEKDVIGSFGNQSASENYNLGDTGGEMATGLGGSENYNLAAGFWNMLGDYTISITCPGSLTMSDIIGSGQSDLSINSVTCNIFTDNPAGYSLFWKADTVEMISTGNPSDKISAYSPAVVDTPETWSIATNVSEWGGHIGSASTTVDTNFWGTSDTYLAGKWLDIKTTDFQVVERTSKTSVSGDDEIIWFGAEVGSTKVQPAGTYVVDVTITALTL